MYTYNDVEVLSSSPRQERTSVNQRRRHLAPEPQEAICEHLCRESDLVTASETVAVLLLALWSWRRFGETRRAKRIREGKGDLRRAAGKQRKDNRMASL